MKPVSIAVMQLWEEGKIDLDADISNYLPFSVRHPKFPDTLITMRMLLTHSASFGVRQPLQNELYGEGDSTMSLKELCNKFFDTEGEYYQDDNFLDYEPGQGWNYSNWGFVLAGYLVEHVTGISYNEYSKTHILEPLEMDSTGWFIIDVDEAKLTTLYGVRKDGSKWPVYHFSWPGYPDGTLRTNIGDFANFLIMFSNRGSFKGKQILKPSTVDVMLTIQDIPNIALRTNKRQALAWVSPDLPFTVYQHQGSPTGSESTLIYLPESKSGFVVFYTGYTYKTPGNSAKTDSMFGFLAEKVMN